MLFRTILVLCMLSAASAQERDMHPLLRIWTVTCRNYFCEEAFDLSVNKYNCLGPNGCDGIFDKHYPSCVVCLKEMLREENFVTVQNKSYLICDKDDALQRHGCSFFCRRDFWDRGTCGRLDKLPVCICYNDDEGIGQTTDGLGETTDGLGQTTDGLGQTTDGLGQTTDGLGQTTDGLGETTDGLGETTDGLGETTDGLGQTTDGLGETTDGLGETTDGLGETTDGNQYTTESPTTTTPDGLLPINWNICSKHECSGAFDTCVRTRCQGLVACHKCISDFFPKCLKCFKEITQKAPQAHRPFSCKPSYHEHAESFHENACQLYCQSNSWLGGCSDHQCRCNPGSSVNAGLQESTLRGHVEYLSSATILRDGTLVSGSFDKKVRIWDTASGNSRQLIGHTGYVHALAALHDGNVASGAADASIKVWEPASGRMIHNLTDHSSRVCTLAVLHNGDLVSGSWDKTVKIWDMKTGRLKQSILAHTDRVCALTVLDNGLLVSGSHDKTIRVWDPANNFQQIGQTRYFGGNLVSLTNLVTDQFVTGTSDRVVGLWSSTTLQQTNSVSLAEDETLSSTQTTSKGNVAIGDADGNLRYWSLANFSLTDKFDVNDYAIYAMTLLRNGQLVTASGDHTLKILNSSN